VQGLAAVVSSASRLWMPTAPFLTGSLADYLLPTSLAFPSSAAVALKKSGADNPLGSRAPSNAHHPGRACVIANSQSPAALRPRGRPEPRELPLSASASLGALIASARVESCRRAVARV